MAYAFRSMTETEKRYAQIEKKALSVTWACDRFSDYVLGRSFEIETDHKPLVPILSSKNLDNPPPRALRFRLRLARFDYSISHVPGKLLYTADTLSRAPVTMSDTTSQLSHQVETYTHLIINTLPATHKQMGQYKEAQETVPECAVVMEYCEIKWPEEKKIPLEIQPYWEAQNSLSVHNGLFLYNNCILVPISERKETLDQIHEGYQGRERCRMQANVCVVANTVTRHHPES